MAQSEIIKSLAKYGLENDQEKLLLVLNELIEHSKKTKKINFALQLQSILKESIRVQKTNTLTKVGSDAHFTRLDDKEINELILEKLTSDYSFENLVATSRSDTNWNCSYRSMSRPRYYIDSIFLLLIKYYCTVLPVVVKRSRLT